MDSAGAWRLPRGAVHGLPDAPSAAHGRHPIQPRGAKAGSHACAAVIAMWWMLLCVVLWGFTPLLWFHPNQLITSTDLFLPITPADWWSQLFMWNPRWGTGAEWLTGPSELLSTGWTALVMAAGGAERFAQQVDFVFWFLLPGLTVWWFLHQLMPGPRYRVLKLVAVNVYMFNLFLESLWGGNKAGLSAYAAMPLLLGILYRALHTRRWVAHAAAFALASILASGASRSEE